MGVKMYVEWNIVGQRGNSRPPRLNSFSANKTWLTECYKNIAILHTSLLGTAKEMYKYRDTVRSSIKKKKKNVKQYFRIEKGFLTRLSQRLPSVRSCATSDMISLYGMRDSWLERLLVRMLDSFEFIDRRSSSDMEERTVDSSLRFCQLGRDLRNHMLQDMTPC